MVTSVVAGSGVAVAAETSGNSTLVVDAAGNTGDYDTIQGAVDAASAGDTIQVNSGEYRESVSIDKSLTIEGEEGATIIGQGNGKGALALLAGSSSSATESVSDVTIKNLIVRSGESGTAINAETGGSSTAAQTNIQITESTIVAGQDDIGLFLANVDGVDVIGTTIRSAESESASKLVFVGAERSYGSGVVGNNVHFNDITVSGAVQARAMELEGANHIIKNSDFTYDVTDSGHASIQLFSDTTTVKGNTFTLDYSEVGRVGLTGVVSIHGGDTVVKKNTITRQNSEVTGVPAIRVSKDATGSVDILSNTLTGGPIGGYAGESTVTVTGNSVEDVSDEGIWFGDSAAATMTIESNSVTDFDTGGQDGSSAVKLTGVPTTLNGQDGLTVTEAANTIIDDNSVPSVSTDGASYDGSITVDGTTYPSIAAAEDAADPGQTIQIASGTYDEQVIVDTADLTISGAGMDATTITGAIGLDADAATIEDLTIETVDGIGEEELEGASERRPAPSAISVGGTDDHTIRNVGIVGPGQSAKGNDGEKVVGISFDNDASTLPTGTTVENVDISQVLTGIWAGGDNLRFTGLSVSDTAAGVGGIEAGTVTIENSEFKDNSGGDIGVGAGTVDLSGQTGLAGTDAGGYTAYYTTIQEAVDNSASGEVTVLPGTYTPSSTIVVDSAVEINGAGTDVTTIDASNAETAVKIEADGVSVSRLSIKDTATKVNDGREAEAIFVGDANDFDDTEEEIKITNVDIETVRTAGSGTTVEGIHAKSYDSGHPINGLTIQNVDISDVKNDVDKAGANGIKVQADVNNVEIAESTITGVEGVWSYGIGVTPSGPESGVPEDVVIQENEFETITGTTYAASAIRVGRVKADGQDPRVDADASELTITHNDFVDTAVGVSNADRDRTVIARHNWWGDASGPAFSENEEGAYVDGDVAYDPFLTKPQSETAGPGQTTAYAHDLTIPVDEQAYALGFPADVSGTVGEVFGENFDGNIWAYDAESDEWNRIDDSDTQLSALDAVVVDPNEDAEQYASVDRLRIDIAYAAPSDGAPAQPPETELSAGWNFVAAPQFASGDEAFAASTADPQRVLDVFGQPGSQPYEPVQTPTGDAGNDRVSPFSGYWVYVTEDGTLAGAVPQGTSASDEPALLVKGEA